METVDTILQKLEECKYKISTDTRKDLSGSVYFALRGENFDGNVFVSDALQKGACLVVTDNPKNTGENVLVVKNVLKTLQQVATEYRKKFNIPIIAIGGSNGKTTSKDLVRNVLKTKYKVHATEGSLNNHFGVPLSLLQIKPDTEIAVFEIGANHPGEHLELLNIIQPTHVVVTNNGMDHLEGFGSPEGISKANAEMYDWALAHSATAFVNKKSADLMQDSEKNLRSVYPEKDLETKQSDFLTILLGAKEYKTNLVGNYNIENIELAIAVGTYFKIEIENALKAVCAYIPSLKRSQFITKNGINFVVDCYNANPTSMKLSLESFLESDKHPKGVILGDMLELGSYSDDEHKKIVEYVLNQKLDQIVFVGEQFKKALGNTEAKHEWFLNSDLAKVWFAEQKFDGFTFLLKGSRGIKIEKILE